MAEEEKKKHKWIKGATENAHGQFRKKAEAAGESTLAYAHKHDKDGGKLGKEAVLAENLMTAHHKDSPSPKKIMNSFYGKSKE